MQANFQLLPRALAFNQWPFLRKFGLLGNFLWSVATPEPKDFFSSNGQIQNTQHKFIRDQKVLTIIDLQNVISVTQAGFKLKTSPQNVCNFVLHQFCANVT